MLSVLFAGPAHNSNTLQGAMLCRWKGGVQVLALTGNSQEEYAGSTCLSCTPRQLQQLQSISCCLMQLLSVSC